MKKKKFKIGQKILAQDSNVLYLLEVTKIDEDAVDGNYIVFTKFDSLEEDGKDFSKTIKYEGRFPLKYYKFRRLFK